MMVMVDEEWDRLSREEIREVMERSNQIWKERKWIESGKVDNLEEAKYRGLVIDYLKRGEKINAIKIYRTNKGSSLKEAKDYVDALTIVLQEEGSLPK